MKIAVISDIHGNLAALETVLSDIQSRKVDRIICTGDLVGYGPYPDEVVQLLDASKIQCVMGNYDDAIGYQRFVCGCDYKDEKALELGQQSIAWTLANTSKETKLYLRQLPQEIRIEHEGQKLLAVHGSPNALNEYIFEDISDQQVKELLQKGETNLLICGHTHKPFYKKTVKGWLINAGSVGKPKHGSPDASYILITLAENPQIEIVYLPYDYQKTAKAIEEKGLPAAFAEMLRKGVG